MSVSATELTHLRNQPPTAKVEWYAAVAPYGTPIFEGRVAAEPTPPFMEIEYSVEEGNENLVEAGMTVWIGSEKWSDITTTNKSAARDKGRLRVRSIDTANNIIEVAESDAEWWGNWASGDRWYLTVVGEDGFRELWSKYQRLSDDGDIYKDYDITYGSAGDTGKPGENIKPKDPEREFWLDIGLTEDQIEDEDFPVVYKYSHMGLDTFTLATMWFKLENAKVNRDAINALVKLVSFDYLYNAVINHSGVYHARVGNQDWFKFD